MAKMEAFGHKSGETYCSGYVDVHGHWNNGFQCPSLEDNGEIQYCCGNENHKYCCVQIVQTVEPESIYMYPRLPLLTGLMVTLILLLVVATVLCCYFCKYCVLYKRRKRNRQDYVMYEGDSTAQANEFVVIPGEKCYSGTQLSQGYNTLDQNATHNSGYGNTDVRNKKKLGCKNDPTDAPTSSGGIDVIPGQGRIYKNPMALANDRDSGYYPSVLDCDSMTCLTENLTLKRAREKQMMLNHNANRHSWSNGDHNPGDSKKNKRDSILHRRSEDREFENSKKNSGKDEGENIPLQDKDSVV